ncbi:MAG: LacI family DNA-binding transcriptional regulator [Anaerolineae bacterium]
MNGSNFRKARSVTIIDVARESGVSYSTVSRVLSGYEFVKDETRERVLDAARRLGYVVNIGARSLAGGKSQIIGLLVPGLDNGYVGEIARGIDEELSRANYDLMLYTTHRQRGKETTYVRSITNGLTDGLLLIVPLVTDYLKALQEQQFPYVLIDQSDPSNQSDVIDATNWQGALDATNYLIDLGHRRIGLITGLMQISSAVERLEGYKAALAARGIAFDPALVAQGDFWQPQGYEAACELLNLANPPTAIFASNDLSAFGAMEAARERGLRIPEDISIVGFDDIPQASLIHPKLTTVRQPLDQMGSIAVRMLLERIENPSVPPRHVTLETQLIVRDSCKSRS